MGRRAFLAGTAGALAGAGCRRERRGTLVLRLSPLQSALRIKLPAALPYLFTGVKLSVAYAFIGVIASEFILSGEHPERVVHKAIERMLPKDSPLARRQMKHLFVYAGDKHPHSAQQPQTVDFASMNEKNAR